MRVRLMGIACWMFGRRGRWKLDEFMLVPKERDHGEMPRGQESDLHRQSKEATASIKAPIGKEASFVGKSIIRGKKHDGKRSIVVERSQGRER